MEPMDPADLRISDGDRNKVAEHLQGTGIMGTFAEARARVEPAFDQNSPEAVTEPVRPVSGGKQPIRGDAMPSTFRIPKAPITGIYGKVMTVYTRRTFGQVPDNAYVYFHHVPLFKAVMGFEGKVAKWDRLDPLLKSYAQLASAAVIGCSWCVDFGYFMAHNDKLDLAKVREVPRWRESDVFMPVEREVLEYAEAMTVTPPTVTDKMVASLVRQLGSPAVVELTQMVALENMRSRFNSAAGLHSQGFSDVCDLPLATPSGQGVVHSEA